MTRTERRAAGRCPECGNACAKGRRRCRRHLRYYAAAAARHRRARRVRSGAGGWATLFAVLGGAPADVRDIAGL